jgi:hypothetical protein
MPKKRCKHFSTCEMNAKAESGWHVAGCGETLEKEWSCKKCGRSWREVYVYSCQIDNDTGRTL